MVLKMFATEENFKFFLLETKGYKKQFSSQVQSRRMYSVLERKAKERGEPVSIKLFGKANVEDEWVLLDEVEIEEVYYR
ncbi:hypothetical protein ES705_16505 [subsurface metagenome]